MYLFSIIETNDGYAERVHLDNLCHLPGHTPIFVGYKIRMKNIEI
jgi:hypothetical protein